MTSRPQTSIRALSGTALRLRPDVPEAFLEELRHHLGLAGVAPRKPTLECDGPALACDRDASQLPGGLVASLVRQQPYPGRPTVRGMFVQTFVLDAMYDLIQAVPQWLAVWSLTEGWIGFAREELGLNP